MVLLLSTTSTNILSPLVDRGKEHSVGRRWDVKIAILVFTLLGSTELPPSIEGLHIWRCISWRMRRANLMRTQTIKWPNTAHSLSSEKQLK